MKYRFLWLLFSAVMMGGHLAHANVKPVSERVLKRVETHSLADLSQQIHIDQQTNAIAKNKLAQLKRHHQEVINSSLNTKFSSKMLENKQLTLAEAKADSVNIKELLVDAQQKLLDVKSAIRELQERLRDALATSIDKENSQPLTDSLDARLAYLHTFAELQGKHIEQLKISHKYSVDMVKYEQEIYDHLLSLSHQYENQLREVELIKVAERIQAKRAELLNQLKRYNLKLQNYAKNQPLSDPNAIRLGLRIFQAEEEIFQGDQQFRIEHLSDSVADLVALMHRSLTVREIDKYLNEIKQFEFKIKHIKNRIVGKIQLITSKFDIQNQLRAQGIISLREFKDNQAILKTLRNAYQQMAERTDKNLIVLSKHEAELRTLLNKTIALRQGFPGWNLEEWHVLIQKISSIPVSAYHLITTLRDHVHLSFKTLSPVSLAMVFLLNAFWLGLFYSGRRLLSSAMTVLEARRHRIIIHVAIGLLRTLRRYFLWVTSFIAISSTFYILQIPFKTYRFILTDMVVVFCALVFTSLARVNLVERVSDASGVDVKLYRQIKSGVIATTFIILFNNLSHELNIAYDVRDFFNRIFMLFLFLLSILVFRLRRYVADWVLPYFNSSKTYVQRAVYLLTWLLPAALFSNAIVGLVGYLQLAAMMSYYQLMILLVATSYVIFRGAITEIMELIADATISHSKYGWLLSQAILIPLDKVVRFVLFLMAWVGLFLSFGWGKESYVVKTLTMIVNTPFINSTNAHITILSSIQFVLLSIFVFWAARWSREISYRMLFVEVRDQSMRNSLAAFTRYSTIAIGGFITLQALGINISGLSYILGGLAVGLGFGLRDFANNIVSGVMLLIERPVREGDLVSINEHEGIVSRISLRSMTVKSYDHVEVMVPNADILNKTFVNWTLHDTIARTVLPIKVHRHDEPDTIKRIILSVLESNPSVLDDPEPNVFLRQLDEALIFMEARYFIDLEKDMRVCVQSDVLFSIWERFKQHGIRPPFPQQDVCLVNQDEPQLEATAVVE